MKRTTPRTRQDVEQKTLAIGAGPTDRPETDGRSVGVAHLTSLT
ncbi:hypothetical protein ACGH7X_37330 [Streptomyces sp. BBFR51]